MGMSIGRAIAAFFAAALLGHPGVAGLICVPAYAAPAGAAPSPNDLPVANDARLGGDDTQTRLVIDLSRRIDIRVFTLANPFRVIIDMPQIAFEFPAKTGET